MIRLGLTGGIGCGKSTVASFWSGLGADIIDADVISRSTTAPGGAAIDLIRRQFGPDYIDDTGALDRPRMRELVFRDPTARQALEGVVHPLVGMETERQIGLARSAVVILDIPLLIESGRWRSRVDRVLVVDCSTQTQIDRTTARSGLTSEAVAAIMAQQASRQQRLACADAVIHNEGISLDELKDHVRGLARRFGL